MVRRIRRWSPNDLGRTIAQHPAGFVALVGLALLFFASIPRGAVLALLGYLVILVARKC